MTPPDTKPDTDDGAVDPTPEDSAVEGSAGEGSAGEGPAGADPAVEGPAVEGPAGDDAAPEGESGTAAGAEPGRGAKLLLVGALALLVLCAAAAVWFGTAWIKAGADDALDTARARDEAVRAGEQAVLVFHTMDYRSVDAGLDRWVNASTGAMLDELGRGRASGKAVIEQSKRVTTATAYSTALIDINDTAGTATVISAVHQVVNQEGKQPEDKYLRVQAALQRVEDGGWKLSGLTYIAATPSP